MKIATELHVCREEELPNFYSKTWNPEWHAWEYEFTAEDKKFLDELAIKW